MTPEEKAARRYAQTLGLCDSDVPAERHAALDKIHSLGPKYRWPKFVDLPGKLASVVTPEQLEGVEKSLAQWKLAHDALAQRHAAQATRIAALRSALWLSTNWGGLATFAVVIALGYGAYRWLGSGAEAAHVERAPAPPVQAASAEETEVAAVDAGLRDVLSRTRWGNGDSLPVIVTLGGVPYWIVVRGTTEKKSHVDAQGHPIERRCLQLFASEAVRDAGAFITPAPYLAFGMWMKWPERAAECRMPGRSNY